MRKNLLALSLALTFVFSYSAAAQTAAQKNSPAMKAVEAITAKQMNDYLYFIASDVMEGRDTPSRGLDTTAEFIRMNLSRWGFKPAGDTGTFFQKIALRRDFVDPSSMKLVIDGKSYVFGEDFMRLSGNAAVSGPLVFGKDGWMIKSKNIDAFNGMDVKGKIVVLSGTGFSPQFIIPLPAGVTQTDLKGVRGTDWADPVTNARNKGAAGILLIAPPQLQAIWGQIKTGSIFPEKLRKDNNTPPSPVPVILISGKTGEALGVNTGNDSISAQNADLNITGKTETLWTQNVAAIWEGDDPVLKTEMVAVGAHYDHIGISRDTQLADRINNGADDDGSGTTALLAMAEALANSPKRPKRSVLFVWHCGEEKDLWGSRYFTQFPTVDLKNVIAQLNIDMIGRSKKAGDTNPKNAELSGENAIYVIGSQMMSSQLGKTVADINNSYLKLNYDLRYDDPKDPNRFFFRSDHFNYAQKGIPITFWFDGVHEDYHQPGDEPQKIDYAKMEKITRTIFLTMWELADAKTRPAIDKQLPAELQGK